MVNKKRLPKVMRALGIIPLRHVIVAKLNDAGYTDHSDLNFDEFLYFMATYRVTEGFTTEETETAQKVFNDLAILSHEPKLKMSELSVALMQMFGSHALTGAKELAEKLFPSDGNDNDLNE